MEFENQYLNYDEYQELGGTLEETPFNLFEYKSEMEINKYTFNRLTNLEEIPKEVKLCVFDLMRTIFIQVKASEHSGVSSENTDGYSISYSGETTETNEAYKDKIEDIIKTYLSNVKVTINNEEIPVLYRGVK